jgi:hypothetical protein
MYARRKWADRFDPQWRGSDHKAPARHLQPPIGNHARNRPRPWHQELVPLCMVAMQQSGVYRIWVCSVSAPTDTRVTGARLAYCVASSTNGDKT